MANLRSGKRADIDTEERFLPPNPILAVLRDRILEFLPIGLNKIWFRIGCDDEYLLAGALGFSCVDYDNILRFGGFITTNFKLQVKKLQRLIGIEIEKRDVRNNQKHDTYIRFNRDIFGSNHTIEASSSTPDDRFQLEYVAQYATHPCGPTRSRYIL
jgi:hypothetical protein